MITKALALSKAMVKTTLYTSVLSQATVLKHLLKALLLGFKATDGQKGPQAEDVEAVLSISQSLLAH